MCAASATWPCRGPFPFFVKAAFGTASAGIRRIADAGQHAAVVADLRRQNRFGEDIIVQAAVRGPLERTQAVFDRGRLVASHIYRQIADGPGGGDVLKKSVNRPEVRNLVARIGGELGWHGALSFDYILDEVDGTPRFFDANPRIVEPMSARLSGVDLAGALLGLSLGEAVRAQPEGRSAVVTRLGLMGLLDAAQRQASRWGVAQEIGRLMTASSRYRGTIEELTPVASDPPSVLAIAYIAARLLLSPSAAHTIAGATVSGYSLSPEAIDRLRAWAGVAANHREAVIE